MTGASACSATASVNGPSISGYPQTSEEIGVATKHRDAIKVGLCSLLATERFFQAIKSNPVHVAAASGGANVCLVRMDGWTL